MGTKDADAYDFFLRGRYLLERRGAGVIRAARYFSDAIGRDSSFARAYAGLSEALELFPYFAGVSAASVEDRAMAAANRALALDSTLAEAHMAVAMAHEHANRWAQADVEFRRAVALDSGSSVVGTQYGRNLLLRGLPAQALVQFRRAERLDPSDGTPQVWTAFTLSHLGDNAAAVAEARKAWETDSLLATAQSHLAIVFLAAGDNAKAIEMTRNASRMSDPFNGISANSLYHVGNRAGGDSILRALRAQPNGTWMLHTALTYTYLGIPDTARALKEMDVALRAHEILFCWEPFLSRLFDPVRHSEHFAAIVRASGLDPKLVTAGPPAATRAP